MTFERSLCLTTLQFSYRIALFEFGLWVFHIELISNHVMVVVMLVKCSFLIVIVSWYQVRVFFPLFLFCSLILISYNPCTLWWLCRKLGHMQALLIDLLMSIYTPSLWHMGVDSSQLCSSCPKKPSIQTNNYTWKTICIKT